jgi:hypothetical protein
MGFRRGDGGELAGAGRLRVHVDDSFGNRIELLEPLRR